ncbi:hypothetical protein CR983_03810 [Candidatus Saccharibacteria bacterium]|nr:MAG: hypothetical protein CR983_03810 [Candidatus Saccharibacteria bacterium]
MSKAEPSSDQKPPKKRRQWRAFQRKPLAKSQLATRARKVESSTLRHAHRFVLKRLNSLRLARRHIIAWSIVVSVVLLGIGAQLFLYADTYTELAPARGGTYAEGAVGIIDNLNPIYASSGAEVAASRLMFSSLYSYDSTGKLIPDLAKSIKRSKDGDAYTVVLRDNAKWHDGADVTAEDVVFTIATIKDPEARARASLQVNWRDIKVEQLDDLTVRFSLPPYAAFAHALTFPVLPKHILQSVAPGALQENSFSTAPIGSGPFEFRLLQTSDSVANRKVVHMRANTNYYGGAPRLDRFELYGYESSDDVVLALKARALSGAVEVPRSVIPELGDAYTVQQHPVDNGVYVLLNNANPLLKDVKMRQIIQRIIDTEQVRADVGGGVRELHLPFIGEHIASGGLPAAPQVNRAKAAKLLDNAKWKRSAPDGVRKRSGKEELALKITTTKNPQYERAANSIAEQLREAGFAIDVVVLDDKQPNSNFIGNVLQQRDYDMLVYELPIGADPDVYAYWHSSQLGMTGYNFANYSNATADAALSSARDRADQKLRDSKYVTFAKQWLSDAPAIGLYQQSIIYVHRPSAHTMPSDAVFVSATDRYADVTNWTVESEEVYKTP